MANNGSVSHLIDMYRNGHREAAQDLWTRYLGRLIRLARQKLGEAPRRVADEQDVANRAFEAFLSGVEDGRFSQLEDRNDLWQILVMLTEHKAVDQIRTQRALKRGGDRLRGGSALGDQEKSAANGFEIVPDPQPTPELAMQFAESVQCLLEQLDDDELRTIALAKLESCTNAEIAERLKKSVSTIERKLNLIRKIWNENGDEESV